jgi:N-acetylmuramoyl-L-alanine amidase
LRPAAVIFALVAVCAVGCSPLYGGPVPADQAAADHPAAGEPDRPDLATGTTPPGSAAPGSAAPSPSWQPTTRHSTAHRYSYTPTRPPTASKPASPQHSSATAVPRDTVVVLDPGHNGLNAAHPEIINQLVPAGFGQYKPCNTTGVATATGYPEHAYNWDLAVRAQAILAQHGITVLLTRPSDTGVGPCVNRRAAFGNAQHAAVVVAIHADGHVGGHGFHVIEAARWPAGAAVAAASHRLAVAVHDRYVAESGFAPANYIGSGGYDRRSDLAGLNLSLEPTIFIECGNMRDSGDAARMQSATGRQRAAQAIADGILGYLAPG